MANIQKELEKFFRSETGETIIGQIVLNCVNQALKREIRFEDGRSEPGKTVEKTEVWNILDWMVKYLPQVEAAVRGCQADSAGARNRSAEVRNVLSELIMRQSRHFDEMPVIDTKELIE